MNSKKNILLCCIITFMLSCGNNKSGTSIPEGNEAPKTEYSESVSTSQQNTAEPKVIVERVNAIYEAVAAAYPEINDITPSNDELDDAYCTSEWNTLVQMINSKDADNMGKAGFFESDYWVMNQDWGKISISDVKVNVKDSQHANATFNLHNLNSITKVTLELVFERGEWLISNFINETNKTDWKKNMMKYLEDQGKEKQEEAADDGIIEYAVP